MSMRLEPADRTLPPAESRSVLPRRFGLLQATALNMTNMIGVGPFITIPLLMTALGGPQAMLGWLVALLIVIPDGMVWSELGSAMPGSGGSYVYLRQGYGPETLGPPGVVPFHLAVHPERAARDCVRLHRLFAVPRLPVAVADRLSVRR